MATEPVWRVTAEVLIDLSDHVKPGDLDGVRNNAEAAEAAAEVLADLLERGIWHRVSEFRGTPLDGDELRTAVPFRITVATPFTEASFQHWFALISLA